MAGQADRTGERVVVEGGRHRGVPALPALLADDLDVGVGRGRRVGVDAEPLELPSLRRRLKLLVFYNNFF